MATIKDIAREVGVSHATVSNVLNHKGNVSAQKIKLVMDAAKAMGYRVNEAASSLRSGGALILAVILPDIGSVQYADLYRSLCQIAAEKGYSMLLRLTDNVPAAEYRAIQDVLSSRARCAVVVTSLADPAERYAPLIRAGVDVVFALRGGPENCLSAGFDMETAAQAIADRVLLDGSSCNISLMTNMTLYPAESAFRAAFVACAQAAGKAVTCVQSISTQYARQAFSLFAQDGPDAIVTTCEEMALAASRAGSLLGKHPRIYSLASQRLMPSAQYISYQLNFRHLGYEIGRMLMSEGAEKRSMLGTMPGFTPKTYSVHVSQERRLSFLTADTPVANALMRLAPRLKQDTGLTLSITTLPTQEVSRTFSQPDLIRRFDMARMDLGLMNRWAADLFTPLEKLNVDMARILSQLLPGIADEYAIVKGLHYALPFDPGCHLLFYREDLFNDPHFQREYYEMYRETLRVPTDYPSFLRTAQFLEQASAKEGSRRRGTMITRRSSECISELISISENGRWPMLTPENLQSYIDRQRALEKCAAVVENGSWSNAVSRFAQGECAMLIAHSNYARHLADEPLSRVSGRVGYARAPGGKVFLSGGVIGVLNTSAYKPEAGVFLSWLLSHRTSGLIALLSGCSPWAEAYENEELADIYPWLEVVRDGLLSGARRKFFSAPQFPFDAMEAEKEIARICELAVRGKLTCTQAAGQINALGLYAIE